MTALHPLAPALSHPSPQRAEVSATRLVAGALISPLGYGAQVIVSYVIGAVGCAQGRAPWAQLLAVNLAALVAILGGLAISLGNFRRTRGEAGGDHARAQDRGDGRTRFLAYCGLCSGGIFALATLIQLTAVLVLDRCIGAPALG